MLFNGNRVSGNSYLLLPASVDRRDPGERTLYLRYSGRLEAVAPAIGQAIRTEDSRVPVVSLRTLDGQLETDFWPVRALTTLLAMFAVVSLVIAIIGQYAVVAFDMRRRIRDFGVRIALGASSRQILVSVLKDGLKLTAIGLADRLRPERAHGNWSQPRALRHHADGPADLRRRAPAAGAHLAGGLLPAGPTRLAGESDLDTETGMTPGASGTTSDYTFAHAAPACRSPLLSLRARRSASSIAVP